MKSIREGLLTNVFTYTSLDFASSLFSTLMNEMTILQTDVHISQQTYKVQENTYTYRKNEHREMVRVDTPINFRKEITEVLKDKLHLWIEYISSYLRWKAFFL